MPLIRNMRAIMWKKTYSKEFQDITPEEVWDCWTRVNDWTDWHSDLDSCQMEGEFKVGNHFMLKPKGAKSVKITITDVQPLKQFTDCTSFPGAKMYDTHAVEEIPGGVRIKNELVVTGPLKWLWIALVAKKVADSVPEELEALVELKRGQGV